MIVRFHIDQIERGRYEYRVSYEGEDLYADSGLSSIEECIIAATEGVTAIVGTVRPAEQPTGRRLHNSAAIIRNQKLLGFADKTLLPEYDVFDDPRYFEPGRERHDLGQYVGGSRAYLRPRGRGRARGVVLGRQLFRAAR